MGHEDMNQLPVISDGRFVEPSLGGGQCRFNQVAQTCIRFLLNPTLIRVRALTSSGNHTCATHGTGMRNKTSRSLREVGQRIVAQSPARSLNPPKPKVPRKPATGLLA